MPSPTVYGTPTRSNDSPVIRNGRPFVCIRGPGFSQRAVYHPVLSKLPLFSTVARCYRLRFEPRGGRYLWYLTGQAAFASVSDLFAITETCSPLFCEGESLISLGPESTVDYARGCEHPALV